MAVFWFGWGKKLKNALTKKQADSLYLPKSFEATINELKTVKYDGILQDRGGKTFENHGLDISKPIYVSFRRIRDNSDPDAGLYGKNYYSFVYINYNLDTTWTVYGSDYYYRGSALIQNGDRVALAIRCVGASENLFVQARCWNTLDKITNIRLTGYPKK